jgi:hypothetical protein
MRAFTDVAAEHTLQKFLDSPFGTLYFVPYARGAPSLVVRRFDGEWPPALAGSYADLMRGAQQWIERHPDLARLVQVEQPLEVGRDFVARKHLRFHVPTTAYVNWDDPPEPPAELEAMRAAFRAARRDAADERDQLIAAILARSILEPSGKTFFLPDEQQFIIAEPKPTRGEIERWAELTA